MTASAVGEIAKHLHWKLAGFLPRFELFFDELVHLVPKRFRYDRLARDLAPFAFRFVFNSPCAMLAIPIEVIDAFGAWVDENASHLHIPPQDTVPGAVAGSVKQLGHRAFAAVLQE